MKLCVRLVDLELHFPNTLSNTKMVYVSNVDLDKWTNLAILNLKDFWKLHYTFILLPSSTPLHTGVWENSKGESMSNSANITRGS
jgi:hypothetical protein